MPIPNFNRLIICPWIKDLQDVVDSVDPRSDCELFSSQVKGKNSLRSIWMLYITDI